MLVRRNRMCELFKWGVPPRPDVAYAEDRDSALKRRRAPGSGAPCRSAPKKGRPSADVGGIVDSSSDDDDAGEGDDGGEDDDIFDGATGSTEVADTVEGDDQGAETPPPPPRHGKGKGLMGRVRGIFASRAVLGGRLSGSSSSSSDVDFNSFVGVGAEFASTAEGPGMAEASGACVPPSPVLGFGHTAAAEPLGGPALAGARRAPVTISGRLDPEFFIGSDAERSFLSHGVTRVAASELDASFSGLSLSQIGDASRAAALKVPCRVFAFVLVYLPLYHNVPFVCSQCLFAAEKLSAMGVHAASLEARLVEEQKRFSDVQTETEKLRGQLRAEREVNKKLSDRDIQVRSLMYPLCTAAHVAANSVGVDVIDFECDDSDAYTAGAVRWATSRCQDISDASPVFAQDNARAATELSLGCQYLATGGTTRIFSSEDYAAPKTSDILAAREEYKAEADGFLSRVWSTRKKGAKYVEGIRKSRAAPGTSAAPPGAAGGPSRASSGTERHHPEV